MLSGEKILITGVSGQIAGPLAAYLAKDNEVWGIARFRPPEAGVIRQVAAGAPDPRQVLEAAGIKTLAVDLASGHLDELPSDFTYVVHLAVYQVEGHDYDTALRVNAEGTGLLMEHCRRAKGFLHMSSCSVYKPQPADPDHLFVESDALGDNQSPFAPTYSVSKIAAEAVARYCARQLSLPTTIARMEVSYGRNGGWPAYTFDAMRAGAPVPVQKPGPNLHAPIHEDDICEQLGKLLQVAAAPAVIVNWGGDDVVSCEDWLAYMGELSGIAPIIQYEDHWITSSPPDKTRRLQLVGPCRVHWKDGFRRMLAERYPDVDLRATVA
jgi:nucleoside-diphosphate-sugar epimerase